MWLYSIFWLIAAIVFVGVEAATTALVSVWFAVGAVAALVASLFTQSLGVQLVVFAVVSAIALAVMVPALAKRRAKHAAPVTNGSPLTIGKQGVVLTAIEPGLPGRVRVDGLDWQAKAGVTLAPDTRIVVNAVDGALLIVSPVTEKTTV